MHALYGVDTDDNNTVDTWTKATGYYAHDYLSQGDAGSTVVANFKPSVVIRRIKAVRIGLIVRTSLPEKTSVSGSSLTLFSDLGASLTFTAHCRAPN